MSRSLRLVLIWLLGSVVTAVVTLQMAAASYDGARYLPVGHDSFYHGRRVLDAVESGSVAQFDPLMHAPQGDWVTWPWLYDTGLAWATRALMVVTGTPAETALMHVPPLLGIVGAALVVAAGAALSLPESLVLVAALCFGLHAFTQYEFGVGSLDHHGAEQLLSIAAVLLGMRWLQRPDTRTRGLAFGVLLGAAIGVHPATIALYVPLAATCALLWIRGELPSFRSMLALVVGLFGGALAVLLPAATFWQARFDLYYLSLLHLYVACAMGAVLLLMAYRPYSMRRMLGIGLIAAILLVPLLKSLLFSGAFISGDLQAIRNVDEIGSPFTGLTAPLGIRRLIQVYTLLVWLAPPMIILSAVAAVRAKDASKVFFWTSCAFGLAMLVLQRRLGSYGVVFLYLPVLVLLAQLLQRRPERGRLVLGSVVALGLIAYAPTLRYQLFGGRVHSMDEHYATLRPVLPTLAAACRAAPGVVLADPGDGHLVRYFTDCAVIGNNFRLTPTDVSKVNESLSLIGAPLDRLRSDAPYVRYVVARLLQPAESPDPVLFEQLLEHQASPGAEPLVEVQLTSPGGTKRNVLGVYRIGPDR